MKKATVKRIVWTLFVLYILLLMFILFFSRVRNTFGMAVFSKEHLSMVNLIPFSTVMEFFNRLQEQTINADIVIRNLVFNLFMFVPMGMALPVLFEKKFDKLWKVTLFVFSLVIFIEIIQFITFLGSADIDDLILNTLGTLPGYGIIRIPIVRKMLKLS